MFEVSEEELQEIVKASANAKELKLFDWDIHCSKTLDFIIEDNYSIQILDFDFWGSYKRKTDWMADPSLFENIVAAISKCGLKDSLKKIKINKCGLDVSNIEEMFRKYGMNKISIWEKEKDSN